MDVHSLQQFNQTHFPVSFLFSSLVPPALIFVYLVIVCCPRNSSTALIRKHTISCEQALHREKEAQHARQQTKMYLHDAFTYRRIADVLKKSHTFTEEMFHDVRIVSDELLLKLLQARQVSLPEGQS